MLWNVVLEKALESLLDCKAIKPLSPKGNQSWIFIGRTDAEAEAPILWPPDAKSQLIGKDPDAGKDWRQEEKGTDRMRQLDDITDSMDKSLSKFQKTVKDRKGWPAVVHEVCKESTLRRLAEWLNKKTTAGWFWHPLMYEIICSSEQPFSSFPKILV